MSDVGCGMANVGCGMADVGWRMLDVGCIILIVEWWLFFTRKIQVLDAFYVSARTFAC